MNNNQRLLSKSIFFLFSFFTFFLISCDNHIGNNYNPPVPQDGKGSFTLTLSNVSRTIMPQTPSLSDFAVYNLCFTPTSSGTAENVDRTNITLSSDPVILDPGTYTLTVYAYKDSGKTHLVAQGTVSNIIVTAGGSVRAAVTLKTLLDSDTGTFRWDIYIPNDVTTASMIIIPHNANGTAQQTVVLSPFTTSGNRILISGLYNLIINLEKADGKVIVWSELLYIYGNLDSVLQHTFTDDHFNTQQYTVTFKYNDGGTTVDVTQSVLHGGTVTCPADPVRSDYMFAGWYTDSGLEMAYNFDTQVIENVILHAQWECTVTFYDRGNIVVTRYVRTPSTNISSLPIPSPPVGYFFSGWNTFSDGNGENFTINTTIIGNIAVYAQWSVIQYTVKAIISYGEPVRGPSYGNTTYPDTEVILDISTDYFTSHPLAAPSRNNYIFHRWERSIYRPPIGGADRAVYYFQDELYTTDSTINISQQPANHGDIVEFLAIYH